IRRGSQERPPRTRGRARVGGTGARRAREDSPIRRRAARDRHDHGDLNMDEHHITTRRTARYYTLGQAGPSTREVWFVCHGYGQLAGRFLEKLRVLDDGGGRRLLVAPEGLSRFYLSESHAERRVGACWMTREDRLAEIDDYVQYLDAVYAAVFSHLDRTRMTVHAMG